MKQAKCIERYETESKFLDPGTALKTENAPKLLQTHQTTPVLVSAVYNSCLFHWAIVIKELQAKTRDAQLSCQVLLQPSDLRPRLGGNKGWV